MTMQPTEIPDYPHAKRYEPFKAIAQVKSDYEVDVTEVDVTAVESKGRFGTMMCVCTEEGAIYITKEQAKAFFGLKE